MKVYKKDILIFLKSHIMLCDYYIKNYDLDKKFVELQENEKKFYLMLFDLVDDYFDNDEEIVF